MHFFQVLIFLTFIGILNAAFFCYHGSGTGKKYEKKPCPSKICIIYNAACGGNTSTTCYNAQNPMKVINTFKASKFYYANTPQSSSFGYCTTSECNKDLDSLVNPIIINSDPSSFDYMLTKSLKMENINKQLQNGIKFPKGGIGIKETFKFIGKTFKASKFPWITFSCTYSNASTMRFQISFNLKQSKLISKTITVVNATEKIKQLNHAWTNPTKIGGKITVTLKNNINSKLEFSVNNVVINGLLNDNTIKAVNLVTFGGGWIMKGASLIDTKGKTTALKMLPTFYSDLIPINFSKLKGNSSNQKVITQDYFLTKEQKEDKQMMDTVDANGIRNYEFRISINPQSDLVKLQFQAMPLPPRAEYIIFWKRVKSVWTSAGIVFVNKGVPCDDYTIGVAINRVNFYCGRTNIHNISFPNIGNLVKYRVRTFGMPSPCPAKDPFKRLLGRMPRITDYSF